MNEVLAPNVQKLKDLALPPITAEEARARPHKTNMVDTTAPHSGQAVEAEHLLNAISAMEGQADRLSEKLGPFDKAGAMWPANELSQLREGLKRIAARIGVCVSLAERIAVEPKKAAVGRLDEGDTLKPVVTPEDKLFPLEGFSDDLTALPSRRIAEKAIDAAIELGRPRYIAVFCLDRICHMSGRYGTDVGHQAIRHCAQFLSARMPADSLMFRWRGASFAILFDHSGTISEAKLLMEQIAIEKQMFNFMTNNRTAMVNLTVSFLTVPFATHAAPDAVYKQIDAFIEGHSGRQPH